MSARREQPPSDTGLIPPIEIGSVIALGPGRSEFIGSASGVFFADNVFRAFAGLPFHTDNDLEDKHAAESPAIPGSAHGYLAGSENPILPASNNASLGTASISSQGALAGQSYGYPALGVAPALPLARELAMAYFRHWHPVFPFLHGPSFLDEVNKIYTDTPDSYPSSEVSDDPERKLCRAVTVQCIFNIAATTFGLDLEPACRIQSTRGLIQVLGSLFISHTIHGLQALLAAELYLITVMSVRGASTIHGALTRIIYHTGLHRCPFRYSQLSKDVRGLRKRIFWCAYVFDRHLGQALGHPLSFSDREIDVCIPSMPEIHQPVVARSNSFPVDEATSIDVQAQRPNTLSNNPYETSRTASIENQATVSSEPSGSVLGYMANYSQLLGEILGLFHRSIHDRVVVQEKVQDLTYRIHAWWNKLPAALQTSPSDLRTPDPLISPYKPLFNTLYNHILLLLNRPFLSLPRKRLDFKLSLQSALNASHALLSDLKPHMKYTVLMSWPATLSSVWTAGLVISLSTLLGTYPLSKGRAEISQCLNILSVMSEMWISARQSHAALEVLLRKLCAENIGLENSRLDPQEPPPRGRVRYSDIFTEDQDPSRTSMASAVDVPGGSKRQRRNEQSTATGDISYMGFQPEAGVPDAYTQMPQDWISVPQYIGPDFGFDASQFDSLGEEQQLTNVLSGIDFGGFFSTME